MANKNISFDVEYDLVVIGGGGAGKSAAYTAATEGNLHVALLEKKAETGGSSIYAEGTCAYESSEQKERKVPPITGELNQRHYPTREDGFRRYIDYSHHRANPEVARMFVDNSAETIDIMKSLGVTYTDVTIYAYNQPLEVNSFHRPDGLGERVQELLLRACINAGVDIFTSTPAKKIIMNDGVVVGVEAQDSNGNTMKIGCKAVVIASGGFGNSPELVEKHSWLHRNAHHTYQCVPTENTGDGLKMALEVGADTESLGTLMIIACARSKTLTSHVSGAGSQPVLWVNKTGRRFASEEVAMSFADCGNTMAKQPEGVVYAIIDSDTVKHLMEEGSDVGLGDFIVYKQKLNRLQAELDQDVAEGIAWKGNNIEELAKNIGLDPAVLANTVAEYNDACDKGYDPMFYKSAKFLRPVRKATFYAINMAPSVLVSCGGIRVNGNLQVTDKDYNSIPGLYAVGMEASGLYGDTYNLDCPGTANGFAHTSGRVAARHAIKTIKA